MCGCETKLGYRRLPAVRDRQKSRMAVWKLALFISTAVDIYRDSSYTLCPPGLSGPSKVAVQS